MVVASPNALISNDKTVSTGALVGLYESVGWTAYTQDPHRLAAAVRNSSFVATAWMGDELVGLVRAMSDDVSIAYLQDVLVRPSFQGAGIGHELMQAFLERYSHVRQKVLLTDDRPDQLRFYQRLGFWDVAHLRKTRLHAFVRYEGVDLA
jgi:GNAT superfamily N-acetyltransferase